MDTDVLQGRQQAAVDFRADALPHLGRIDIDRYFRGEAVGAAPLPFAGIGIARDVAIVLGNPPGQGRGLNLNSSAG
jgi:hypothetical protein